jgi:hypothetical protein
VGRHESGCIYERVGNGQSYRILIRVDKGRMGKNGRNFTNRLKKHGILSYQQNRATFLRILRVPCNVKHELILLKNTEVSIKKLNPSETPLNANTDHYTMNHV